MFIEFFEQLLFSVLVVNPSFAPAVRKPCEVLSVKDIRKSVPSFLSPELEQHLQKFPSTSVKYCGWQLESYYYIALDSSDYFFEVGKNGYAPVDNASRTYARHESIHLSDCLNRNVTCRRLFDEVGILCVTNLSIPAWGCLHSLKEPGCARFFRCKGEIEFIQLDSFWTRALVPFCFEFACGNQESVAFSKSSVVRLVVEHNAQTLQWRVFGSVFRKLFNAADDIEPERDPEGVMTEDERAEWQVSLPQIPASKAPEMFSASKIENCKKFVSVRDVEYDLFERRSHGNLKK
jgi:hypothetical protein